MKRILIADDHAMVRRGVRGLLVEEFGKVKIVEATDAREALALLAGGTWDLALVDINMPGRSGLDVLIEARRLHPALPVLILSAYGEEEFALRAFKLGAAGYLNKQSASDELLVAVRKVMAGGKYVTAALAEKLAGSLGGALDQAAHETLSAREMEVLRLVALGRTIKEVAGDLGLSEKTIGTYRTRVSEKLGIATNVELARYAMQHRLVD